MPLNYPKISKYNAMRKRIKEIVVIEERPFSFIDFKSFIVDGVQYELKHGVIRNYLSKLARSGEIEFAYNCGVAFYTLPGNSFTEDVTPNHMEGPFSLIHQLPFRNTPIYNGLKIAAPINRLCTTYGLHLKLMESGYSFVKYILTLWIITIRTYVYLP